MGRAVHDGRDAAQAGGSHWTFQFRRNQSNQGRGGYAALHILISYKPTLAITHEHNINCSGPKVPNNCSSLIVGSEENRMIRCS